MSEKEKEILTRLSESISKLSKENQSYVLGVAEGMAMRKEQDKEKAKKEG